MIATHVDDVPGVATSTTMIEYILGAIRVVYACEMVPWRKVLGFKVTVGHQPQSTEEINLGAPQDRGARALWVRAAGPRAREMALCS